MRTYILTCDPEKVPESLENDKLLLRHCEEPPALVPAPYLALSSGPYGDSFSAEGRRSRTRMVLPPQGLSSLWRSYPRSL